MALVGGESCVEYLDGALTSLDCFGGIAEVPRVVFVEGHSPRCEAIATLHRAAVLRCGSVRGAGPWLKSALYSITHAVEAKQYLCMDADLLVLDTLAPLFEMHAALPAGQVLIGPEATRTPVTNLRQGLRTVYLATAAETDWLLAPYPGTDDEPTVVNDGVFVADFEAPRLGGRDTPGRAFRARLGHGAARRLVANEGRPKHRSGARPRDHALTARTTRNFTSTRRSHVHSEGGRARRGAAVRRRCFTSTARARTSTRPGGVPSSETGLERGRRWPRRSPIPR